MLLVPHMQSSTRIHLVEYLYARLNTTPLRLHGSKYSFDEAWHLLLRALAIFEFRALEGRGVCHR